MTGPTDNSQSLFFFLVCLGSLVSTMAPAKPTVWLFLKGIFGFFWVILVLLGLCASTAVSLSTAGAEILVFY